MAASTRILALNLGMQTITLAEFRTGNDGSITLHTCKEEELIVDPAADATRPAQVEAAVGRLRQALAISAREKVNFCLPSQSVFTRFVKLPGSTPEEVESIIGFEAQQNVPFPIDEVVWDHQILGNSKDNTWNVALVAMKADQLTEASAAISRAGLKPGVIDVAPMALYNAFRYNYSDLSGCSLLIDIGARTTNLIFVEDQRVFSRSIPVGGSTISAAIAKEFKQDISVGEKLKIEKGFVGLGGAYAEPEDPTEMKISKIVRNTMTRLHADIARSISFYRQNQAGNAPVRAFLCGRAMGLPYMVEFFSEKLQMPIAYLNPLKNVTVANEETATYAANKAHALGELVGCALRSLDNCPVEINLRPPSVVREQDLARRRPFLILASICVLLGLASWYFYFNRATDITQSQLDVVSSDVSRLQALVDQFTALNAQNKSLQETAAPLILAATERSAWAEIIDEVAAKLPAHFIWITNLQPLSNGHLLGASSAPGGASTSLIPAHASGQGADANAPTTTIEALQLSGLYLTNPPNEKEARIIDEFVDQLRKSSTFQLEGKTNKEIITQRTTMDGRSWAYAYTIVLPLRNPIVLP